MKRLFTFLAITTVGLISHAQNDHHLSLKGDLMDIDGEPINNVRVIVVQQTSQDTIIDAFYSKKCKINLPLDSEYRITFSHPVYLDKYLTCNTNKSFSENYKFDYDVYMGKAKDEITIYDKPVGHIEFNYPKNSFVYNTSITRKRMREYNALLVTSNP